MAAENKTRVYLAEILVGSLTAVAFEEMVAAIHRSTSHGQPPSWETLDRAVIFGLTTIRFLVGNLLYLISKNAPETGGAWFYDLMMVLFEAVLLAILGSLVGAENTSKFAFSFFGVFWLVLGVDGCWVVSQFLFRGKYDGWKWLLINVALLLLTIAPFASPNLFYARWGIWPLVLLNACAFAADLACSGELLALLRRHSDSQ